MRTSKSFWANIATRIDNNLQYYNKSPKIHKNELTHEKAIELYVLIYDRFSYFVVVVVFFRVRSSRVGIDDEAAKLLVERSIRRDKR
jgi:hypothetical protein